MHKFAITPESKITSAERGTAFLVQVKPEAKTSRLIGGDQDVVYVELACPPRQKAVNRELTAFFAKTLQIKPEKVVVASGSSIEKKIVIVMGMTPEDVDRHLSAS